MFRSSKGRYSDQKKHSTRDVLSYEDIPLDDYEQEKTDISIDAVKKIIIGVCVALAAGLIVYAFANRDKLTWDNISAWWSYDVLGNAGNGYPVDIIGTDVASGNFAVNQEHVAYASDTSFVTLNSTGSEVANIQLRYSNPVMKTADTKFLTYGLGSKSYQIQSFDKNVYSGEAESVIFTGDIASNGIYCLVTDDNGFLSTLCVYNKDNNRIYKYSFSEYYVHSVALNKNGTGCIAVGVTSNNGAMETCAYVLDFTQSEAVAKYIITDDSIIDSEYVSDDYGVIIGKNAAYIIKNGDDNYTTKSYEDRTLANYCFNPDTQSYTLALSRSGDGRSCAIETFSADGEKTLSINTEYSADSISMYKGYISVLDANTLHVFGNSGIEVYTSDTGTGSKRFIMNSDSTGYLLSVNQIRRINFKNPATNDTALTTAADTKEEQ